MCIGYIIGGIFFITGSFPVSGFQQKLLIVPYAYHHIRLILPDQFVQCMPGVIPEVVGIHALLPLVLPAALCVLGSWARLSASTLTWTSLLYAALSLFSLLICNQVCIKVHPNL